MNLTAVLEVVIGLFFVYLVLSAACTHILEWLAAAFQLRASNLENAVRLMLDDPSVIPAALTPLQTAINGIRHLDNLIAQAVGWLKQLWSGSVKVTQPPGLSDMTKRLYNHPLIKALGGADNNPSYIPSGNFALAFFDMVMTAGTDASSIQTALKVLKAQKDKRPVDTRDQWAQAIEDCLKVADQAVQSAQASAAPDKSQQGLIALHQKLDEFFKNYQESRPVLEALLQANLPQDGQAALDQLARGTTVLAVNYPAVSRTVTSLITQIEEGTAKGEKKLAQARANAEDWFNSSMERAGGWYKRTTQWWLLGIAAVLVLGLNIDTLDIARTLWRDPVIRQAMAAQAQAYVQKAAADSGTAGQNPADQTLQAQGQLTTTLLVQEPVTVTLQLQDQLLPLQLGWDLNKLAFVNHRGLDGWATVNKLVGLALSVLAAMQGAPFWFELLSKFINIRNGGQKPETTPADSSAG
jgi:hypothetical protein